MLGVDVKLSVLVDHCQLSSKLRGLTLGHRNVVTGNRESEHTEGLEGYGWGTDRVCVNRAPINESIFYKYEAYLP